MSWGFFSDFWNLIVGVAEYPVEFFQNIGYAVAGALGSFFDTIFHNFNDIFVFFVWIGVALKTIFLAIVSPLLYFFNVLRWFFTSAFGALPEAELTYAFPPEVLEVFSAIPHWDLLSLIMGAIILLLAGVATLKLLLRT
jgi:hypothetical protein